MRIVKRGTALSKGRQEFRTQIEALTAVLLGSFMSIGC